MTHTNEQTAKFLDSVGKLNDNGKVALLKEMLELASNPENTAREQENGISIIRATLKNIDAIEAKGIVFMGLMSDENGEPMLEVETNKAQEWHFPFTQGYQVHVCNTFLRSLNLGVDVEFKDFNQYAELIHQCNERLFEEYGDEALMDNADD